MCLTLKKLRSSLWLNAVWKPGHRVGIPKTNHQCHTSQVLHFALFVIMSELFLIRSARLVLSLKASSICCLRAAAELGVT